MGLNKQITLPNAVVMTYHCITEISTKNKQYTRIIVSNYINQQERNKEQNPDPDDEWTEIYRIDEQIILPYDPTMNIISAYEYVKTLEQYHGSIDIFEEGQTGTLDDIIPDWEPGVAYMAGDRVMYSNAMWVVIQAHTSQADWTPDVTPALFAKVHDSSGGDIPEWEQPVGGHDAYSKGDHVMHKGKEWISDIDANVWEPGVYGWSEA